jgi:hypothetical protein
MGPAAGAVVGLIKKAPLRQLYRLASGHKWEDDLRDGRRFRDTIDRRDTAPACTHRNCHFYPCKQRRRASYVLAQAVMSFRAWDKRI